MKTLAPRQALLASALLCTALTSQATLVARDLDGNAATIEAYYDTTLDISWLADASSAQTLGASADGRLSHADAVAWVAGLNVGGVSGWRLPGVAPVNGAAFNFAFTSDGSSDTGYAVTGVGWGQASELGHLFYVTLGNAAFSLTHSDPFVNLDLGDYWTGQSSSGAEAFFFNTDLGLQSTSNKTFTLGVWAVRDGDVGGPGTVPEPAGTSLVATALLGLALARRRQGRVAQGQVAQGR